MGCPLTSHSVNCPPRITEAARAKGRPVRSTGGKWGQPGCPCPSPHIQTETQCSSKRQSRTETQGSTMPSNTALPASPHPHTGRASRFPTPSPGTIYPEGKTPPVPQCHETCSHPQRARRSVRSAEWGLGLTACPLQGRVPAPNTSTHHF